MKGDMIIKCDGMLGFPDDIEHKLFFSLEISSVNVSRSDLGCLPAMLDRVMGICGRGLQQEFMEYAEKRMQEEQE